MIPSPNARLILAPIHCLTVHTVPSGQINPGIIIINAFYGKNLNNFVFIIVFLWIILESYYYYYIYIIFYTKLLSYVYNLVFIIWIIRKFYWKCMGRNLKSTYNYLRIHLWTHHLPRFFTNNRLKSIQNLFDKDAKK